MRIPTDRYTSHEYLERESIWMRVWQKAGRVDEVPKVGDWKEYRIFDQSFVIVRGKDDKLRGFVNACRHRGNRLCNVRQGVQGGEAFVDAWRFAPDAVYSSPYFTGDEVFLLSEFPEESARASTMEAKVYSLTFPNWKPADFKYWPADNGFVMKTRWEGHTKDGTEMGFYSYSFVETNDTGEVSRWETHVNDEYSAFLEVAIGVSGPFQGTSEYVKALERCLEAAGVSV